MNCCGGGRYGLHYAGWLVLGCLVCLCCAHSPSSSVAAHSRLAPRRRTHARDPRGLRSVRGGGGWCSFARCTSRMGGGGLLTHIVVRAQETVLFWFMSLFTHRSRIAGGWRRCDVWVLDSFHAHHVSWMNAVDDGVRRCGVPWAVRDKHILRGRWFLFLLGFRCFARCVLCGGDREWMQFDLFYLTCPFTEKLKGVLASFNNAYHYRPINVR